LIVNCSYMKRVILTPWSSVALLAVRKFWTLNFSLHWVDWWYLDHKLSCTIVCMGSFLARRRPAGWKVVPSCLTCCIWWKGTTEVQRSLVHNIGWSLSLRVLRLDLGFFLFGLLGYFVIWDLSSCNWPYLCMLLME
jgi:hypothetical protein